MDPFFTLLFEDNHLLVVSKEAGFLTQKDATGSENLEEKLKEWMKKKKNKEGNVFLHAIHRLDKPASGLVIFAKTSKALSRLQEEIREKKMQKTYLALVEGHLFPKEGIWEDFIIHGNHKAEISDEEHGKKAILSYRIVEEKEEFSLLEIDLITGRYHQIRLQTSLRSHPIVGDEKYGSKIFFQKGKIALHHHKISFFHPITKEKMMFTSPLPDDFSPFLL